MQCAIWKDSFSDFKLQKYWIVPFFGFVIRSYFVCTGCWISETRRSPSGLLRCLSRCVIIFGCVCVCVCVCNLEHVVWCSLYRHPRFCQNHPDKSSHETIIVPEWFLSNSVSVAFQVTMETRVHTSLTSSYLVQPIQRKPPLTSTQRGGPSRQEGLSHHPCTREMIGRSSGRYQK